MRANDNLPSDADDKEALYQLGLMHHPELTREHFEVDWDRFLALKALVGELRERLGPLTPERWQNVGHWMMKAFWLGNGMPVEDVLKLDFNADHDG